MKVLISAAYYSPHISGLTNSIKNLAELLAQNDYSVSVLTTQHIRSIIKEEDIGGVHIKRIPYLLRVSKGFIMPTFLFDTISAIKKTDHVLINLPQFEGFLVALVGKIMGKKVHSIYVCEVTMQGGLIAKLIEKVLRISNKWTLHLSDYIITLTDDFAGSSTMLVHNPKKVLIVPPVVLEPKVHETAKKSLVRRMPRKDVLLIGFLGRIASEKGIEYLLNAIPHLKKRLTKDFLLIFAGPEQVIGEKAYQRKIVAMLEQYKDNVFRIGELKNEELGAFYSLLDVLVLPSINSTEVFGMVQVEAMLCGTPTVASDLPGVRTIVRQTGMGEVAKKKNAKDLGDKISQVIKYRKSYTKRQNGVRNVYDTKQIVAAYNELLRK